VLEALCFGRLTQSLAIATSQMFPSGSAKCPKYPPHLACWPGLMMVPPVRLATANASSTSSVAETMKLRTTPVKPLAFAATPASLASASRLRRSTNHDLPPLRRPFVGSALAGPLTGVAGHHADGRPHAPIRQEVKQRQVALLNRDRITELSAGLATSRPPQITYIKPLLLGLH
jgi:hypothetical protein